jgi:hypothetical protein
MRAALFVGGLCSKECDLSLVESIFFDTAMVMSQDDETWTDFLDWYGDVLKRAVEVCRDYLRDSSVSGLFVCTRSQISDRCCC